MYLAGHLGKLGRGFIRQTLLVTALTGLLLAIASSISPIARAASPVTYSINPTSGSVQPGKIINIALTMHTDVAMAGGSINVAFSNGSYAGFSVASGNGLGFIDYHAGPSDFVFICSNNNCPPGSYAIGTITAKAGQAGTMKVTFNPKETLQEPSKGQFVNIAADGTSGSYTVTGTAPASPEEKEDDDTFNVPQGSGNGTFGPIILTEDQLDDQIDEAEDAAEDKTAQEKQLSNWSTQKIVFAALGVALGIALIILIILRILRGGGGGPKGYIPPGGGYPGGGSGGGGSTIYPN